MKLKKFIITALFLTFGFLLHQIIPPLLFTMKPDFLLIMMFIAIFIADDYKLVLTIGITSGFLSAIASTFPAGQIPNILDKLITTHIVYLLVKIIKNRIPDNFVIIIASTIGTFISGIVFLISALILVGLPTSFKVLILSVVIPATLINTIAGVFLFKVVQKAMKCSLQ